MKGILILALFLATNAGAQTNTYTFTLNWTIAATPPPTEGQIIYWNGTKIDQVANGVATYKYTATGNVGQQFCYVIGTFNHQYPDGTGNLQETKSGEVCMAMPAAVQPIAPFPPTGLTATTTTNPTGIRLSWADNSDNEKGFELRRQEQGPNTIIFIAIGVNTTVYRDTNVKSKSTYCYQVRAKGDIDSTFSNQACETTN